MDFDALFMQSEMKSENSFPLELKICFEELVKFTLRSHLNDTLGFHHLGLSKKLCSALLKDNQTDPYSDDTGNIFSLAIIPKLVRFLYQITRQAMPNCICIKVRREDNFCSKTVSTIVFIVKLIKWLKVGFFDRPFKLIPSLFISLIFAPALLTEAM